MSGDCDEAFFEPWHEVVVRVVDLIEYWMFKSNRVENIFEATYLQGYQTKESEPVSSEMSFLLQKNRPSACISSLSSRHSVELV